MDVSHEVRKKKRERNVEVWRNAIVERFPSAAYSSLATVFIDVRQDDDIDEDEEEIKVDFKNQLKILHKTVSEMKRFDCKDITAVKVENDQLKAEIDQLKATFKSDLEEEQKKHKEDVAKLTQDLEKIREQLQKALKQASLRNKNSSKTKTRDQKNVRRKARSRDKTQDSDETSSTFEEEADEVYP